MFGSANARVWCDSEKGAVISNRRELRALSSRLDQYRGYKMERLIHRTWQREQILFDLIWNRDGQHKGASSNDDDEFSEKQYQYRFTLHRWDKHGEKLMWYRQVKSESLAMCG